MSLRTQIAGILNEQFMEEITAMRRQLHQQPELSFQEYHTSETIRAWLDQWGIAYTYPHVKTGIVAHIRGDQPGRRIALRTDMDALPVTEQTGLPFALSPAGHPCPSVGRSAVPADPP